MVGATGKKNTTHTHKINFYCIRISVSHDNDNGDDILPFLSFVASESESPPFSLLCVCRVQFQFNFCHMSEIDTCGESDLYTGLLEVARSIPRRTADMQHKIHDVN